MSNVLIFFFVCFDYRCNQIVFCFWLNFSEWSSDWLCWSVQVQLIAWFLPPASERSFKHRAGRFRWAVKYLSCPSQFLGRIYNVAGEVINVQEEWAECSFSSREGSSAPGGCCLCEIARETRGCSLGLSSCWNEGLEKTAKRLYLKEGTVVKSWSGAGSCYLYHWGSTSGCWVADSSWSTVSKDLAGDKRLAYELLL